MQELSRIPLRRGAVHQGRRRPRPPARSAALLQLLDGGAVTDLLVIAHGWNNDMDDARALYRRFFERVRAELDAGRVPAAAGRSYAVLGVLWPSKKFADKDLIPSGAAGLSSAVTDAALIEQLDDLKGVFTDPDGRRQARTGQAAGR